MDLKLLRYSPTHEWASLEGNVCTVGITKFAVEQLTDIVHIELNNSGYEVSPNKPFGEIESVKSVNDLYSPVAGTILARNEFKDPSVISEDPYGKGWLVKIKLATNATLDHLLTLEQYEQQIASEGH
jgi:glycine cleavage system H protein